MFFIHGILSAEGRTRTGTPLPTRDFKSLASTNSATPANIVYLHATKMVFILAWVMVQHQDLLFFFTMNIVS